MARLIRGALVALIAVLVGLGGTLPAQAVVAPTPSPSVEQYACENPSPSPSTSSKYSVDQQCQLAASVLTPVCDNEVPKLKYSLVVSGTPNTTVTITWINPTGPDVVYADQPLTGTVNWPGSVQDSTGRGIDWPGWTQLADGSWVEGDEYDWVRPSVNVLFEVNPEATVTVAYPPSSPSCNTNPPGEEVLDDPGTTLTSNPTTAVLSATGSDAGPMAALGAALVVIGALTVGLVAIARRRRTTT